jgi:hypothetical protein
MTTSPNLNLRRPCWVALALLALVALPANAGQFALFGGSVAGIWKTTVAVGSGYRAHDVNDPQLIGAGAGQTGEFPNAHGAVQVNDDPELNFPHTGDRYSSPLTLVSELSLIHNSGQGVFVRVRAWYDMVLMGNNVPHGSGPNMFTPNSRLVDHDFVGAAKFQGFDVYDVFYFANARIGDSNLKLRLGRQAIDWGEGLFYPGINAFNPYDYAWLNMPGAPLLNGGKLPVNRIYLNWAGGAGWTLDGFFNLEWRPSTFPGCGTYGSGVDNGVNPGCNSASAAGIPDQLFIGTRNYYNGKLRSGGYFPNGETNPTLGDRPMTGEPSQWSGWGVSAHTFVESIATDFGLYYTTYTSPFFINAAVAGATSLDFSLNTMFPEGVKAFALSASTGLRNLSLEAQVTRTLDFPTHYNAPAYVQGGNGTGPLGWMRAECVNDKTPNGSECKTYYRMNITQLQYGGTWQFGQHVGLPDATLTAEADMQWNTNLPPIDGPHPYRLGRLGNFGEANWTNDQGYVCNPGPLENGVVNRCEIKGFVTNFAWGYKLRLATSFPQGPALTFIPALTWGQDVKGFSADAITVVEGRWLIGVFLRTLIYQNYYVDLNAVRYNPHAKWDPLQDKGQYTFAFGMNF